jgi:CBS domain-containing protein
MNHDTLMDCIDKMLRKRIKRMPVVDAEKQGGGNAV